MGLELLFVISLALCQIPCCVVATPVPEVPPAVMIVPYYLILSVVIPTTILVIAKYSYHAYRRGNNLHAYPMELARCNLSQKSQPSSIITSSTRRAPKSTSKFMKYFTHPVCVGFLGSPNWETGCSQDIRPPRRKRLSKKRSVPRISPKLETNNSQEPRFRSAPLHPVFLPKSPVSIMEVFSPALDISDCSAVHPHSPPCNDTTVSLRTPVSHHGSSKYTPRSSERHDCSGEIGWPVSEGYSLYERHGSLVTSDERNSGPLHAQRNEEISFSKVPTPPDCSQAFDRSKRKRMAMQFSSPLSQYASGSSVAEPPDVILSLSSSINVSGSLSTASKGSTSTTFDRSAGSYSGAVTDLEHNILGIKGWELDDLLKDGKLDVDAVNNILGLNTMSADDLGVLNTISGHPPLEIEYGRMHDRDLLGQHIRSPGKPLCVIPEETEDIIEHVADIPSSASFWDNRLSSDKYSSKRNSTCLEIDLSILGPPVIEDYVLWENQVVMDSASISASIEVI